MARLISRQKQIPNGFVFYQPQTGWKAPRFASFDKIVDALVAHRKGNPFLAKKFKWNLDREAVAIEVDEFNAAICLKMGWTDYVTLAAGGQSTIPFPKALPQALESLGKLAAGGKVLVEWITSGQEAVENSLAESRAEVCSKCPLNAQGDWTSFFTVPVSRKIREALEARRNWNLTTSHDDKLKVCDACYCPLPLKVHMPIDRILSRIPQESFDALALDCWIRKEKKE